MLGTIRVFKYGVDCGGIGELESVDGAELGAGGCGVWVVGVFPVAEYVSCAQRYGCKD